MHRMVALEMGEVVPNRTFTSVLLFRSLFKYLVSLGFFFLERVGDEGKTM